MVVTPPDAMTWQDTARPSSRAAKDWGRQRSVLCDVGENQGGNAEILHFFRKVQIENPASCIQPPPEAKPSFASMPTAILSPNSFTASLTISGK
jgi:hypothetical protein